MWLSVILSYVVALALVLGIYGVPQFYRSIFWIALLSATFLIWVGLVAWTFRAHGRRATWILAGAPFALMFPLHMGLWLLQCGDGQCVV
jgi:hypothetical protein